MKKTCPTCDGTGYVEKTIYEMTIAELATEAHRIVWEEMKGQIEFPSNLLAILYELKSRLVKDC